MKMKNDVKKNKKTKNVIVVENSCCTCGPWK